MRKAFLDDHAKKREGRPDRCNGIHVTPQPMHADEVLKS